MRWEVLEKRRGVMAEREGGLKPDDGGSADGGSAEERKERAKKAVRDFCSAVPELAKVIITTETEAKIEAETDSETDAAFDRGCRIKLIRLGKMTKEGSDLFSLYEDCSADEDWKRVHGNDDAGKDGEGEEKRRRIPARMSLRAFAVIRQLT